MVLLPPFVAPTPFDDAAAALASALLADRRALEARQYAEKAVAIFRLLGLGHPDTLDALELLAEIERQEREKAEREALARAAESASLLS